MGRQVKQSHSLHTRDRILKAVCLGLILFVTFGVIESHAYDEQSIKHLSHTNMCQECDLTNADFRNRDFRFADLRRANLQFANLSGAKFYWANLYRADLTGANLLETDLSGANLYGSKIVSAEATGAIFRGADLRDIDFRRTNLSGADFSPFNVLWYWATQVSGANFLEANLHKANLTDLDLRDASSEQMQIESSILCRTITVQGERNRNC